jgi:hypothetical protein
MLLAESRSSSVAASTKKVTLFLKNDQIGVLYKEAKSAICVV